LSLDVVTRTVDAMKMGFPLGALGPKDGAALRVPADFVIDPTGAITMAFYGSNVSESVPFDTVGKVLGC
jgi:peroxiredoxin